MAAPANLRGWGQGWPVNRSKDMRTVRAARSGVPFTVHHEIAPIIKYLVDEVERRGYLIHTPGQTPDDWSYNNRPIAGTRRPSNHSWGLAVDIDATQYPLGSRRRLPSWIVELFRAHGFDYGGDWSRPDPMHFEFNGWPSDARRIAARLGATPAPAPPPPAAPAPAPPPVPAIRVPEEDDMGKWFRINDGGEHHGKVFHVYGREFVHITGDEWAADQLFHGAVAKEVTSTEFLGYVARRGLTDGRKR